MASSNDGIKDNTTPSNDKQTKPDNPFIQFRQFADTQISSLLQGIVGLPSAFQKRSSNDPRWAGIDEGLRRRDEIQERQKELKESEARKQRQISGGEERGAKIGDGACFPNGQYVPLGKRQDEHGVPTKDLPLYSAVTKPLFAHLQEPDFDEADWNHLGLENQSSWGGKGFLFSYFPGKLRKNQVSPHCDQSILELTHLMVYNELNTSRSLRSEHSLLPYLIFSPYSPLRFDTIRPDDNFYSDAFEDLLATSELVPREAEWEHVRTKMPGWRRRDSPQGNMDWIANLHRIGILQGHQTKNMGRSNFQSSEDRVQHMKLPEASNQDNSLSHAPETSSQSRSTDGWITIKDIDGRLTEVTKNPRTEQEMYEHFLNWASSTRAIKEVVQAGEAFLASFENDGLSGRREEHDEDTSGPSSLMKEILEVTKAFRELSQANEAPLKATPDDRSSRETKSSESPDRVVSSSTTTEQTVHEDGTVETSITVWKKYGSGRETSTTTHHCEDPAVPANADGTEQQVSENATKGNEKGTKNEKSGWFWN